MIPDADEAIRALLERGVLRDASIDIAFDAPSEEWSERRNTPTVDVFLFDIHEDTARHMSGKVDIRNDAGHTVSRARRPRWFNLTYVLTAWAQRPEDEHRILASLLHGLARYDAIPAEYLSGTLTEAPIRLAIAQPRPGEQGASELWSTLGRRWKASLELVVTAPVDLDAETPAPLVTRVDSRVHQRDPDVHEH